MKASNQIEIICPKNHYPILTTAEEGIYLLQKYSDLPPPFSRPKHRLFQTARSVENDPLKSKIYTELFWSSVLKGFRFFVTFHSTKQLDRLDFFSINRKLRRRLNSELYQPKKYEPRYPHSKIKFLSVVEEGTCQGHHAHLLISLPSLKPNRVRDKLQQAWPLGNTWDERFSYLIEKILDQQKIGHSQKGITDVRIQLIDPYNPFWAIDYVLKSLKYTSDTSFIDCECSDISIETRLEVFRKTLKKHTSEIKFITSLNGDNPL